MAQIDGSVTKLEVVVADKVTSVDDLPGVGISGTVWVSDALNTPWPGLAIDLGSTDLDGVTTMLGHSASDKYTLATTGSLP